MSLARLLTDQKTRLSKLIALMEHEQSLLTQGNIDGNRLVQLAEDKQALLSELDDMESLRHSVQQRLGYADSPEGAPRRREMPAVMSTGKRCWKKANASRE